MKIDFSLNLPIMAQPINDHYETATDRRYEVDDIQMGQSNTRITLMGFGSKWFNSIHFKFYLHDREIDIYNSGLINRYRTVSLPGIRYMDNRQSHSGLSFVGSPQIKQAVMQININNFKEDFSMKTKYEEIVNVNAIGKAENPISLNEILKKANDEQLTPSKQNKERVLFVGIDVQQDFMDNGALGVPGAHGDVERMTRFIYNNMDKISNIAVSIDTHTPHQIFHPCWWIDENGNNPAPYTPITLADLDSGKWRAVINPMASRDYVEHLEKDGKKTLVVWSYHCIQGTTGCALENQFSNMIYFHSVAKKSVVQRLVKGQDPLSEMYGVIKPEYDTNGYINLDFLNKIEKFDKVIIGGEAKSHCVMESIKQILEHYETRPEVTKKIYILDDCMSIIPGFEDAAAQAFDEFKTKYHVNLVNSTDSIL